MESKIVFWQFLLATQTLREAFLNSLEMADRLIHTRLLGERPACGLAVKSSVTTDIHMLNQGDTNG